MFLKAPLAPIYTNLEGGALARKNATFWSKFSKKCLKMPFLDSFFKILPAALKIWAKQALKRAKEHLKKNPTQPFFLKIPPTFEKTLETPLSNTID